MKSKTITVNQEFLGQMREMMVGVFNEGCEKVIFPRMDNMQDELEEKITQSEIRIKKELREEFYKGQQSLSNTLEEVIVKLDKVVENQKAESRRIDKLERVVKIH